MPVSSVIETRYYHPPPSLYNFYRIRWLLPLLLKEMKSTRPESRLMMVIGRRRNWVTTTMRYMRYDGDAASGGCGWVSLSKLTTLRRSYLALPGIHDLAGRGARRIHLCTIRFSCQVSPESVDLLSNRGWPTRKKDIPSDLWSVFVWSSEYDFLRSAKEILLRMSGKLQIVTSDLHRLYVVKLKWKIILQNFLWIIRIKIQKEWVYLI